MLAGGFANHASQGASGFSFRRCHQYLGRLSNPVATSNKIEGSGTSETTTILFAVSSNMFKGMDPLIFVPNRRKTISYGSALLV